MVSPPIAPALTPGVASAFSSAMDPGTFDIGAATGIPKPPTSWHVEHRPKLRTASENNRPPRAASPVSVGRVETASPAPSMLTSGFAIPFNVATYAITATKSGGDNLVLKDAMLVSGTPFLTTLSM